MSTTVNKRWLELFAAKHDLDLQKLRLPLLPVKDIFIYNLLFRFYSPPWLLALYQDLVLTNMSPPLEVAALNKKLQEPAYRDLPETKHWLSLYGHGPDMFTSRNFNMVSFILRDTRYFNKHDRKTRIPQIQDYVFEQAKLLIYLNQPAKFEIFMQKFEAGYNYYRNFTSDHLGDAKPVLKRIISFIDSLRTDEWQRNPNRQPEILPQTLNYRLILLPYPPHEANEQKCLVFAKAVRAFVREICKDGKAYHEDLHTVHTGALKVMDGYKAQVACLLGDVEGKEKLGLVDVLCVGIAAEMFVKAEKPRNEGVVEESRRVLKGWRESPVESVRMKGGELLNIAAFVNKEWGKVLLEI